MRSWKSTFKSKFNEIGWKYYHISTTLNIRKTNSFLVNYPKIESQNRAFFAITTIQFVSTILYVMFGDYGS